MAWDQYHHDTKLLKIQQIQKIMVQVIVNQEVCVHVDIKNSQRQIINEINDIIGRSVGVGPMRRPADRKIDTSPYSSGNGSYLSPPNDSSWRRTSSDSAIHQTITQNPVENNFCLFFYYFILTIYFMNF